jgi:hypothetical protein
MLLLLLLLFTAIGFSPGDSSPYTSTHKTNGNIIYIKVTIQNKIHTVNTSTHIRTPYTHYKNIHTLTKTSTPQQKHPHLTKTPTH